MSGITDLKTLLASMQPELLPGEWVFCSVAGPLADYALLEPLASFRETEGLTLLLEQSTATGAGLSFTGCFRQITLNVHSSLTAVGLTAAVATRLTRYGISANVIAAYYHDHLFVPTAQADTAVSVLRQLSEESG